ncbi:MAG: hypothetical protein K6D96_07935 [Acetatifactor sp.]|nr:hypothetical protein [Acetatifactor sp.]
MIVQYVTEFLAYPKGVDLAGAFSDADVYRRDVSVSVKGYNDRYGGIGIIIKCRMRYYGMHGDSFPEPF